MYFPWGSDSLFFGPEGTKRSRTPWLWFMSWGHRIMMEEHISPEQVERVYRHPYAVTSRKLPPELFG